MPHLPLVPKPGFHEAVSSLVIPGWWGMTVLPYPHLSLGRQGAGGRRAVTGPWTESVAWGHGTTWGPVPKRRRDVHPSPAPVLGWGPFVPLLTLCLQHEPSHCTSLEETSGRLRSSPPPECIFPCACRLLLLLGFSNAVFPSLLWFWVVFGRSGHHPYAEGESSPAQLLWGTWHYFPIAAGWTGDCVRNGSSSWGRMREGEVGHFPKQL